MNSITFELDEYTVQIVNDRILIWKEIPDHEPDIDMNREALSRILSTSGFLITKEGK